jgi:hypothetical protein
MDMNAKIEYRNNFVQCYLTYKRRMYGFIPLTADESKVLENKGLATINKCKTRKEWSW